MRRLVVALFLTLAVFGAAAAAQAAPGEQVLHVRGTGPETVVGPLLAERMTVTARGVTQVAGRGSSIGPSSLGHGVTAVALPPDLRPDEPVVVRILPPEAGEARLIALDPVVGRSLIGARVAGIVLGVFLAIVLLQLAAFAITRERSIPWYIGLLVSLAMIELVRDDLFPIWHTAPAQMLLALDLVATIFTGGFAVTYLRLWDERRDLFWVVCGTALATVVIGCAGLIVPPFRAESEALRPPLIMVAGLVLTGVLIVRALRFPPAWILLGGFAGLAFSIAYRVVRPLAGDPFLDRWAFEIGATIDALAFAIAIIVSIRHTIFERRSIERRLEKATHESMHDDLTGVLNRRGLFARAGKLRTGTLFAIDLDAFKSINDIYGHAAGDTVLVMVAEALQKVVGADDLIARVGGDEFVIVAPHADLPAAKSMMEQITAAIGTIRPKGVRVRMDGFGASIGYVALENLAFENALRLADTHAYRVKQNRHSIHRASSAANRHPSKPDPH